jgi:GNAT superfamily N-acetyltransferase
LTVESAPGSTAAVRAPRVDEAPAVAALVNAVTADWVGWPPTDEQAVVTRWRAAFTDLERDFRVAVSLDGTVTGYAAVFRTRADRIWTEFRTVEDEDIVSRLLEEVERRAGELSAQAGPGRRVVLRSQVEEDQRAVRHVFGRRGFACVREALRIVIPVDEPPQNPRWPDGISIRPFDARRDAPAVHRLSMTALTDTWEFEPQSFEDWRDDWIHAPGFDPSLWTVAEHSGRIVGLAQCRYERPGSELGWFELLAVDREWRRRGLGRALLLHALAGFHERGTVRVGLGVDAENPTGAFRVATAAGGKVAQRFSTFEFELVPRSFSVRAHLSSRIGRRIRRARR